MYSQLRVFLLAFAILPFAHVELRAEPVRVGWQIPWATQGQIVMALKNTNIQQLVGSDLKFMGFAYGGPLNRAALAGEVDVLFTADQPALTLLDKSDRFKIVARLMYNRTCLYVPAASPLTNVSELKGKTVAGPIGAAAERNAIEALVAAGLSKTDFRLANLDMAQQAALVAANAGLPAWPSIDALFGFDPLPAIFEKKGLIRYLKCDPVVSVVIASRDLIEKRPDDLMRFLRSFQLAWNYYAQNAGAMNRAFASEARLDADDAALDASAEIEPNRSAKSPASIRLTFSADDFGTLEKAQAFLVDRKVMDGPRNISAWIDLEPLKAAVKWPELPDVFAKVAIAAK